MWEPHDPISYFGHIAFGLTAVLAGTLALSVAKGSGPHRLAGKVFVLAMSITALTTIVFMRHVPNPLAIVQSLGVLYMVPSALVALRSDRHWSRRANAALMVFPLAMLAIIGSTIYRLSVQGVFFPGPLLYFVVFLALFVGDLRVLLDPQRHRVFWVRRHLLRMLLAFSFAIMAALREVFDLPISIWATVPFVAALMAAWYFSRAENRNGQTKLVADRA